MKSSIQYSMEIRNPEYTTILEFGVYSGNTIRQIKEASNETDKIYGFDSFEGLPEDWEGTVCNKGFFSTKGQIPDVPGVNFVKGWFDDTLPKLVNKLGKISVLHIDCDLYSSTKTILWTLDKLIVPGTIICFDEWIYTKTNGTTDSDHEQKCFYDYVSEFNRQYEDIEFADGTHNGHERHIVRIIK